MAEGTKGGAGTIEPPAKTVEKKGEKKAHHDASGINPRIGEIVRYVLGEGPRKGEARAAIVTFVHKDASEEHPGCVNLTMFAGTPKDYPKAADGTPTICPARDYDADGAPGTWHREGDPAAQD